MKASGTLGRTRHRRRSGTLARRLFFMQLALIAVVCVALSITSYVSTLGSARQATSERVLSIAETLAHDPFVISSVEDADASAKLQPYALTVIDTAEVDFVTIMDRDRIRYTHPDPKQLGKHYIGSIDQALTGESQVEEYEGTLGESVRAIVPVTDSSGEVTAMVAVGVTLKILRSGPGCGTAADHHRRPRRDRPRWAGLLDTQQVPAPSHPGLRARAAQIPLRLLRLRAAFAARGPHPRRR